VCTKVQASAKRCQSLGCSRHEDLRACGGHDRELWPELRNVVFRQCIENIGSHPGL
jgi:hypothetical protein